MNLKELREKSRISQKELADYLGISQNAVSLYEIGKREPNIKTLIKLSDYFNVSVDYLLGHIYSTNGKTDIQSQLKNLINKRNYYQKLYEDIKVYGEQTITTKTDENGIITEVEKADMKSLASEAMEEFKHLKDFEKVELYLMLLEQQIKKQYSQL